MKKIIGAYSVLVLAGLLGLLLAEKALAISPPPPSPPPPAPTNAAPASMNSGVTYDSSLTAQK